VEKIFGIGWARTGTKTLGACFKILGFKHQSRRLDLVEKVSQGDYRKVVNIAHKYQSFEDWPWIILYKELDVLFPGSKFILTIRDKEKWIKSYRNLLEIEGNPTNKLIKIRRFIYDLPFPDVSDSNLINRYMKHNDDVINYFQSRQKQLLIVDWEKGDGWNELCSFLGIKVPNKEFPHKNRGKYIKH